MVLRLILLICILPFCLSAFAQNTPNSANRFIESGRYLEALNLVLSDLEIDSANCNSHFTLAGIYAKLNKTGKSLEHYQIAASLCGDDIGILFAYGKVSIEQGQFHEADSI